MKGKNISVLFAVFVSMVFAIMPLSLAFLDVSFDSYSKSTYIGRSVAFQMNITNFYYYGRQNFKIVVSGDHLEWYQPEYLMVSLKPHTTTTVNLTFFPTGFDSGVFTYNVTVFSMSYPEIRVDRTIKLIVKKPTVISGIDTKLGDRVLHADVHFTSIKETYVNLMFEVVDENGESVAKMFDSYHISKGKSRVSADIKLPKYMLAGTYTLRVYAENLRTGNETSFVVQPLHNVVTTVVRERTALYEDVKVIVENKGNVIERNHVTEQVVPNNDLITGFVTAPANCVPEIDKKKCEFVTKELRPGDTALITYRLEFWPIYAQYGLIAVIIVSVILFSFFRAAKPTIIKRHIKKPGGKHRIILEIKNPFLHHMKNVIVRDWISPLAHVIHEETNPAKPVLRRRSDAGTEMIWKLGDIKPKETRILTYKIKTLVNGNLKMPRAYMRYHNHKGKRFRIFSKPIVLE